MGTNANYGARHDDSARAILGCEDEAAQDAARAPRANLLQNRMEDEPAIPTSSSTMPSALATQPLLVLKLVTFAFITLPAAEDERPPLPQRAAAMNRSGVHPGKTRSRAAGSIT